MDEELLRAKGLEPEGAALAPVDGLAIRIGQPAALVPAPGGRVHGVVFSQRRSELDRLYENRASRHTGRSPCSRGWQAEA